MKSEANVNVYLLLVRDKKILLSLRQNTGYEDDKWSLASGHQETGESATRALIREAKEEIDIIIKESNLKVVHVMHRKTNRENIDIFMKCADWEGDIKNQETEKCGGLEFYNVDELPTNIVGYVNDAMQMIKHKIIYSEFGWEYEYQNVEKLSTLESV